MLLLLSSSFLLLATSLGVLLVDAAVAAKEEYEAFGGSSLSADPASSPVGCRNPEELGAILLELDGMSSIYQRDVKESWSWA